MPYLWDYPGVFPTSLVSHGHYLDYRMYQEEAVRIQSRHHGQPSLHSCLIAIRLDGQIVTLSTVQGCPIGVETDHGTSMRRWVGSDRTYTPTLPDWRWKFSSQSLY